MKKMKRIVIVFICTLFIVPINMVSAEEIVELNQDEIVVQSEEPVFVELTKEEFVNDIAENNGISYDEALQRVERDDAIGINEAIQRGEIMPRSLNLKYGYWTVTKNETANLVLTIGVTCGVYASYYLPSGSTAWSARRFNRVHDSIVTASTGSTVLSVVHKSGNVVSQYRIQFDCSYLIKSTLPFQSFSSRSVREIFAL